MKERLGTILISGIVMVIGYLTNVIMPILDIQDVPGSALLNNEIARWIVVIILPIAVGFANRILNKNHGWWLVLSWVVGMITGCAMTARYHHPDNVLISTLSNLEYSSETFYIPLMLVLITSRNMRIFRLALIMIVFICVDSFLRPQAVFGHASGMVSGSRTDKSVGLYSLVLYFMFIVEFFRWKVFRGFEEAWLNYQADSNIKKYRSICISLLPFIPGVLVGMLQAYSSWVCSLYDMVTKHEPSLILNLFVAQCAVTVLVVCLVPDVYMGSIAFMSGHIIGFLKTNPLLQALHQGDTIGSVPEYLGWTMPFQLAMVLIILAVRRSPHWIVFIQHKLTGRVQCQ